MEDFEKIKEITLEEAQKILPKNIAYLTMNDGEVIIVNGLDHNKFDKKEKEYEDWVEEQSKKNMGMTNIENGLIKIQEDSEENERNKNFLNKESKYYKEDNIEDKKDDINQNYYQPQITIRRRKNYTFCENDSHQTQIINLNNNNDNFFNNNEINYENNNYNYQRRINNINRPPIMNGMPQDDYYSQNNNLRYNQNPRNMFYEQSYIPNQEPRYRFNETPYTPMFRRAHTLTGKNEQKRGIYKYIRYNNHNYVESK